MKVRSLSLSGPTVPATSTLPNGAVSEEPRRAPPSSMGVILDFSRPGKPTDNSFIESFNGKFRAECLNAHWFMSLVRTQDWIKVGGDIIARAVRRPTGREFLRQAGYAIPAVRGLDDLRSIEAILKNGRLPSGRRRTCGLASSIGAQSGSSPKTPPLPGERIPVRENALIDRLG